MPVKLYKKVEQWNIAAYFSLYRFISLPFLIFFIIQERKIIAAILLLISFLTDAIDGYIARKKNITSERGAKLDSIGDVLTILSGLAAFIVFETGYFSRNSWFIIAPFALFIIQIAISWAKFKKLTSFHTYLAKLTAVFLVITPVFGPIEALFYLAFGTAILEAIEEIIITIYLREPRVNVKGLYWIIKGKHS